MGKHHVSAPRKRAPKARKVSKWHLPHLMVAAGILVALVASVPVGAYMKASVLVAQEGGQQQPTPPATCPPGETGTPPNCSGAQQQQQQQQQCQPPATGVYPNCVAPQPATCPQGMTGTPPNCMAPAAPTNTVQCPGEVSPMHPTGYVCPTNTGTQMSEAEMQAGCVAAKGVWKGMTSMPRCDMSGVSGNMNTNNMQPCPAGVMPTAALPCIASGSSVVDTVDGCKAKNMGWDAANSRCTTANMNNTATGDCWNSASPSFATQACTQMRASVNDSKSSQTTWCSKLNRMATAQECAAGSTKMTPPAGMVECSGKTPSGYPMYAKDQNECAKMLAEQVKWQTQQNQGQNDQWNKMPFDQNKFNQFPGSTPCPSYTTPGGATTTAPCGPMMGTQGMPGMNNGEQGCAPGDPFCSQFYDPEQGFKGVNFEKYKLPTGDIDPAQYKIKNLGGEQRQLKNEVSRLKQEKRQIQDNLTRLSKRSGVACPVLTEYQGALSTLDSAVTSIEAASASTATEAQVRAAKVLLEGINGNQNEGTIGLSMKLHGYPNPDTGEFVPGLDQQVGGCEMLGEFVREVRDRRLPEVKKMLSRAEKQGIADVVKAYVGIKTELESAVADPVAWSGASLSDIMAPPPSECFGGMGGGRGPAMPMGGGFGGPSFGGPGFGGGMGGGFGGGPNMGAPTFSPSSNFSSNAYVAQLESDFDGEENFGDPMMDDECAPGPQKYLFNKLNKLFMNIGNIERQANKQFESQQACQQLEGISEFIASGKVPSMMKPYLREIKDLLREGEGYCKKGDAKGAFSVLRKMEMLKNKAMKSEDYDEDDFDDVEFGVDQDNILNDRVKAITESAAEKMTAKAIEALEARYKDIIDKLEDQVALLSETLSQVTDQLARINVTLTADATTALNNVAKAPEAAQIAISDSVNTVMEVAQGASEVIESKDFSAATERKFEEFINSTVDNLLTKETAESIATELDSVTQEIKGSDKKAGEKILNTFLLNADKLIAAQKPGDLVRGGQAGFTDTADIGSYVHPMALIAKDRGLVTGEGDTMRFGIGTNMNGAQMICMAARTVLDKEKIAAAPTTSTALGGVTGPAWFNQCANALIKNDFLTATELRNVTNGDAAKIVEVKDQAEAMYYMGNHDGTLPAAAVDATKTLANAVDAGEFKNFTPAEQQALLVLKQEGLINGNDLGGGKVSIDGDDDVKKERGMTLWVRYGDHADEARVSANGSSEEAQ